MVRINPARTALRKFQPDRDFLQNTLGDLHVLRGTGRVFQTLQNAPENAELLISPDRMIACRRFDRQGLRLEPLPSQVSHGLSDIYLRALAHPRALCPCAVTRFRWAERLQTAFLRFNVRRPLS